MVGFAAGFCLMFQVAKAMVDKVQRRGERKRQDLLRQMSDAAGEWMDIVDEIQLRVRMGEMQNKSIKDQLKVIRSAMEMVQRGQSSEALEEVKLE